MGPSEPPGLSGVAELSQWTGQFPQGHPSLGLPAKKFFLQTSDAVSNLHKQPSHLPSPSCKSSLKTKQNTFGEKAMPSSRRLAWWWNLQAPDAWRRLWALPRPTCHTTQAPTSLPDRWERLALPLALLVFLLRNNVRVYRPFPNICRDTEDPEIFLPLGILPSQPCLPPFLVCPIHSLSP